jgi:hypothetical protein
LLVSKGAASDLVQLSDLPKPTPTPMLCFLIHVLCCAFGSADTYADADDVLSDMPMPTLILCFLIVTHQFCAFRSTDADAVLSDLCSDQPELLIR